MITFEPIGWVRSAVTDPVDENWGSVLSEIHLADSLSPGLKGLEAFSHVLVVYLMHQATFDPTTELVRRPRGRADMPEVGIFAQRARHRPNPVGITAVELLGVKGNTLTVKGLDAIDGTPILDIKPYFPAFDRVGRPTIPEWVGRLMKDYF